MKFIITTRQYGEVQKSTHETLADLERDLQNIGMLGSIEILGITVQGDLGEDPPDELFELVEQWQNYHVPFGRN